MILVLDTENTTWSDGSPFDQRNFNVCISYATDTGAAGVVFRDDGYGPIQELLNKCSLLVNFNLKYDLHWLRKVGLVYTGRLWCCQTAAFTLRRQATPYPSLDGELAAHQLGSKISTIAEKYWNQGINTHEIPREELAEYALNDATKTLQLYQAQQPQVKPEQRVLFSLLMQDLPVLAEMEWNGLKFNKETALAEAVELEKEVAEIQKKVDLYHTVPCFNWGSPAHLSALLYGGIIVEKKRIPVGFYKTGAKLGAERYRIELVEHHLPRRYTPIRGSLNANKTTWSVDEDYLTLLKGDKELIGSILKIKEYKKLISTYLRGLPQKQEDGHMPEGYIHGQLVQCVAKTGRLASNSPNLQNISKKVTHIFTSRYT